MHFIWSDEQPPPRPLPSEPTLLTILYLYHIVEIIWPTMLRIMKPPQIASNYR